MENTLLVALSRQTALMRELDVVANNMANVNTHGFRREAIQFSEFIMPNAAGDAPRRQDRAVSYVADRATYHDFRSGPLERTDNPMDLAVQGNAFFTVQSSDGAGERYTRNGAFHIDTQGQLVTLEGLPVLGESGPIVLDPQDTDFVVARDGTVSTHDGVRGKLKMTSFDEPQKLVKDGSNLFRTAQGQVANPAEPGEASIAQGMIEGSNVQPVTEMSRLIELNRAYASLATMIQNSDSLRKTAVEQLAAIPS